MGRKVEFHDELAVVLPRLRAFSRQITRSIEGGDHVPQTATERALERFAQYQPCTSFASRMYRIIHTVHINNKRKEQPGAAHDGQLSSRR
jgi:RNA polymerase sigma-70 factor (ECF subfamily)